MITGTILNVQRFCTDDGPGIRTTVFLKGCSLWCIWCHNPESQAKRQELMYDTKKCVTLSGGEPLFQPDFAAELLKKCRIIGSDPTSMNC